MFPSETLLLNSVVSSCLLYIMSLEDVGMDCESPSHEKKIFYSISNVIVFSQEISVTIVLK